LEAVDPIIFATPFAVPTTQGVTRMKIRLVTFASTIVAVFYAAGAAWKL
jgi:hypothetical protein